jgi:phosphoenolpyruvate-protein phosphotransferase (PTS system enzyme I)
LNKQHQISGSEIEGIAASPGIAIGKAFLIRNNNITPTGILLKSESEVIAEIKKFEQAVAAAVKDVEEIKNGTSNANEDIEILETHIEFLTDPQIASDVIEQITAHRKNVTDAVLMVIANTVNVFSNMNDEYMRDRAADVQDIGNRILKKLNPMPGKDERVIPENSILIADDLSPSDTITLDLSRVIGFATKVGGKTSHTAILAKSKHLPAVIGCGNALDKIADYDVLILDGSKGIVKVNADKAAMTDYALQKSEYDKQRNFLLSLKDVPAKTSDGIEVKLLSNISNADDLEESLKFGAYGSGLFRTELLFMNRTSLPTEVEQFEFYKKVALRSKGKPVTVRTMDIGGDKPLEYLHLPKEENPFLGYRGIRISLDQKDIFITQLKAILRASVFGDFKIMFPMISTLQELRRAKEILDEAKALLMLDNADFDKRIQVGIMIEVPSAAITADLFAKEVDFFSIGTNDLCQYTLAADRMNEKISTLYDPLHPAVLRLIGYVIEQAGKHNIPVSMCGELASDPRATLLLMGMGLREFSMSSGSIPVIKNRIISSTLTHAKDIYKKVMSMDHAKSIHDYLSTLE